MGARSGGVFPFVLLLVSLAGASSSCSVLRAPMSPPAVPGEHRHRFAAAGVVVEAAPVRSWEDYWSLFDDNLPEIGLLAVWVEVRNDGPEEIDLGEVKWQLIKGSETLRAAGIDDLFSRYYDRRQLRVYNVDADKQARRSFSRWMLASDRLPPSQSRQGFLFFRSGSSMGPDWNRDAVLIARGRRGAVRNMELPLFNANP
jgi:hypothetical protein